MNPHPWRLSLAGPLRATRPFGGLTRIVLASAAALTLLACVIPVGGSPAASASPTPPPVAAPPVVAGVPMTSRGTVANASLRTMTSTVALKPGEERLLADLLRDGAGLAPTSGVTWLSSNVGVATVNPLSGQVKAVGEGTAVITAALQANPAAQTQIEVRVESQGVITKITIEPATPFMTVGESKPFSASVYQADGTITGNVVWSSSDTDIATVNPSTGVVKARKIGKVTIEATAAIATGYKGIAIVTVSAAIATPPPPVTPTPEATATAAATAAPTASPTATPTASPEPTPTATAAPTAAPEPTPSPEG